MLFVDYQFTYEDNGDITFDSELTFDKLEALGARVFDSYVLTMTSDDKVRLRKVDSNASVVE